MLPLGSYWSWWPVLPPGPWWHPGLSSCQGPCLGPWFSCSWGLWWCPWHVSTGVIGTMLRWANPTLHWLWGSWACPCLDTAAGKLAPPLRGELLPAFEKDGPTPYSTLSWLCGWGHRWANPEGMRARELKLSLCLPCDSKGGGKMLYPLSPLLSVAGKTADPGIMRVRELALPFTSCTQESRPCTLPG